MEYLLIRKEGRRRGSRIEDLALGCCRKDWQLKIHRDGIEQISLNFGKNTVCQVDLKKIWNGNRKVKLKAATVLKEEMEI